MDKRLNIATLKLVGEGNFKFVFEVEDNELGKKVALYILKDVDKYTYKGYNELEMLQLAHHENIIELLYV